MRIISGEWRSRPLVAPKGDTTRPTADRTRETLFSMLTSRLGSFEDLRVLDLFAGSGALGLEALSRGAAHCTFVEQDHLALDALEKNIAKLGGKAELEKLADLKAKVFALASTGNPIADLALNAIKGAIAAFAASSQVSVFSPLGSFISPKMTSRWRSLRPSVAISNRLPPGSRK